MNRLQHFNGCRNTSNFDRVGCKLRCFVVDTDILIDAACCIEDAGKQFVLPEFQQIEDKSSLGSISVVTQMELIIGCRNKQELKLLEHFLQTV